VKPKLKPLGTERLKPKCDIMYSTSAFKFYLRRYTAGAACSTTRPYLKADNSTVVARGYGGMMVGSYWLMHCSPRRVNDDVQVND